jgi:hypothetical protein
MIKQVEDIRLTDEHTKHVIAQEQQRRRDTTATKTARAMILERAAQLELARLGVVAADGVASGPSQAA